MVESVFEPETAAKATRLVPLMQGLALKLRAKAAQPEGGLVSHFDIAMSDVLEGLEVCQKYMGNVAAGKLAPGPSVGRGLMLNGILVVSQEPRVPRWVTEPDQQTLQLPDATPLALMKFGGLPEGE